MKKLLLLAIALFCCTVIFAQQYHPFISESKQWTYVQTIITTENNAAYYLVETGYFEGDTIWNDDEYKKFYKEQVQPNPVMKELSYFFREDTIERKVYVHDFHFNKTALLYDFGLSVGDSFNIYVLDDIYLKEKVIKVDSIIINDTERKRIEFENSTIWIEGLGCVTKTIIPSSSELICIKDENSILYLNSKFNSCDTIFPQGPVDAIQDYTNNAPLTFNVFPNPIETNSVIRVEANINQEFIIEIYSSFGTLIRKDQFFDRYPIGTVQLNKGLYVYRIKIGNEIIKTDKLVVR